MTENARSSSLRDLEHHDAFIGRHIGPDDAETASMLEAIGQSSLDEMTDNIVPTNIKSTQPLDMPEAITEVEALDKLRAISKKNTVFRNFIGQGYYDTHTPKVIVRNILEDPAWYTAYTPYQAEISQGRLEALLNFQTMCADLTGMEMANASMLDEGTAAAEAMTLAKRQARGNKSNVFFVSRHVHPQTLAVIRTRAEYMGIDIHIGEDEEAADVESYGVLLQYPDTHGRVRDHKALVDAVHARKGLVCVATDLLALTLIAAPGDWGADIVVGNSQRFGVPLGFGGPHAAFMACRDAYKRSLPGRLIGVSVDAEGNNACRMALQTREQHIRREKATSNICTAQVLLANMSAMYGVYHGPDGLTRIARRVHRYTAILAAALRQAGATVGDDFFDTLHISGVDVDAIHAGAAKAHINLRHCDDGAVGISLDETTTREDVIELAGLFGARIDDIDAMNADTPDALPAGLQRESEFMTHPVFNTHHSEHELLRYLRRLADKDLALDRTMIPLGSCTMKLNATSEMLPVTWPEFDSIHPLAPSDQTTGYTEMMRGLEDMLAELSGYEAVSLQPNAGAQGELAGLMAITAYHQSRGEGHRNVCLIPESAHGTNPASAHMCKMRVVVTKCDKNGNVDLEDIRTKAAEHSDDLAAIMLTYPSTHGAFGERVDEICDLVHQHGGQVYLDGANMNALMGLAKPGDWGSDVSHLNLHKTFCIPHGGGGPGVGPIGVKKHLKPFLPATEPDSEDAVGMVSATGQGSASILPISWMYITMMGRQGLRQTSQMALLNANYISYKLAPYYKTLYSGRNDLVAHECILDMRPFKESAGIETEDIVKRLVDFGLHAPTQSFPVAGTLMVEPTESEPKAELDRFIEAMIQIREEIRAIENGTLDAEDNPLKHAPHTAAQVSASEWKHAYPRELGAFPLKAVRQNKYWPPVARVDNIYGDKHVFCSCVPIEAYKDDEAEAPLETSTA